MMIPKNGSINYQSALASYWSSTAPPLILVMVAVIGFVNNVQFAINYTSPIILVEQALCLFKDLLFGRSLLEVDSDRPILEVMF